MANQINRRDFTHTGGLQQVLESEAPVRGQQEHARLPALPRRPDPAAERQVLAVLADDEQRPDAEPAPGAGWRGLRPLGLPPPQDPGEQALDEALVRPARRLCPLHLQVRVGARGDDGHPDARLHRHRGHRAARRGSAERQGPRQGLQDPSLAQVLLSSGLFASGQREVRADNGRVLFFCSATLRCGLPHKTYLNV